MSICLHELDPSILCNLIIFLSLSLPNRSRLGCQIIVSSAIDGIRLKVPSETRDIRNL